MKKMMVFALILMFLAAAAACATDLERTQESAISDNRRSEIAESVIKHLASELVEGQTDELTFSGDSLIRIDIAAEETAERLFDCIRYCERIHNLTGAAIAPMALPICMNGRELGTFDCLYVEDPLTGRFLGIEFSDVDSALFYEYVMSLRDSALPLDDTLSDVCMPELNLQTLKDFVRTGESLSWSDFSAYSCVEVAVEPYTLQSPIGIDYFLELSGDPAETPDSIRLISAYDPSKSIDITTEEIDGFLRAAKRTGEFYYKEVLSLVDLNAPGVKPGGFQNVSRVALEHIGAVIAQAENECTISYSLIDVFYDADARVWLVHFWSGTPGGGESVYMDAYGITKLIIYGE